MGKPQRRFGKEFAAEAVRLVEVSGRTQREIARDLGVGLSTLRRWLDKRREHEIEAPPVCENGAPGGAHRSSCPFRGVRLAEGREPFLCADGSEESCRVHITPP